MPDNSNGKVTHQVYINFILDFVIKPCLERGDDFVLKADGDSGRGTGKTRNMIKKWKKDHNLKHYFNDAQSSDLSLIEIADSQLNSTYKSFLAGTTPV